jgi:hypothetical protein
MAVAIEPEHFFFDVAEAKVIATQKTTSIGRQLRSPLLFLFHPNV